MNVLTLLFFVTKAAAVHGKLTVLKGKEQSNRYTHSSRKLLCVSEDDGSGLVWNSNLNWMYNSYELSDRGGNMDFQILNTYEKKEIDCDLNSHDSCMSTWNITGWTLTNSKDKPMGPVLDRRWEDFREQNNFGRPNEYRLTDTLNKSGAFVLSVRGSTDAHILLCDTESYQSDFCYWIIIGGWSNTETVIRKCAKGVPDPMTYPIEPTCAQIRASYFYETLSPHEWKTFILMWNETMKSISVYDTEKLLMTYEDNERRPRNHSSHYNLFLRSSKTMLFRFHTYSFLHTNDSQVALISPVWHTNTMNICLEMIIGLCAECQMEIVLVDASNESNNESMQIIKGSTVAVVHGLPIWQYVRINKTISLEFRKVARVKLTPSLEQKSLDPVWAVANVRMCPSLGTIRYGSIEATQDYTDDKYFWPNVTCQKLFYNKNAVINSVLDPTKNLQFDDFDCPEGMVGPYCSISCYKHLENNIDCRGTVICDTRGCTCPAGFLGPDCNSNCYIGQYGHGCKQTCGWCKRNNCDFATGYCKSGCDNSKRYNISPLCKIGIDTLPPPNIDFINETIIRVMLPVREEYKLIPSGYQFVLWKEGEAKGRLIGDYIKIFNNTTTMIGWSDNLEPGISYKISCILYVSNTFVPVHGDWQNFTTRCTPITHFTLDIRNTSLTVEKSQQAEASYSCPNKWYDVVLENHDSEVQMIKDRLTQMPYEFTKLTPYTSYKITIGKGPAILYSQKVRTLEGAPSQVTSAKKMLSPNGIKLLWDPPLYLNGIIQKYEVVLQVQTYFGCENLKMQPPKNHTISTFTLFTNTTFSDLTPYAHYVVKIAAYTSHRGPEEKMEFFTNQTDIPTAMYSNPRFKNYTLLWDAPRDCTTISGPIIAKITVTGISKAVRNFTVTRKTAKYSINMSNVLYGAETYEARIYAIRNYYNELIHNALLYEKLIFTTPPKASPPVRDLEIYEIDSRSKIIHLRWLQPEPPINGEMEYYIVSSCHVSCKVLGNIRPTEYCALWKKYICTTVKQLHEQAESLTVSAVNVNVSIPSTVLSVQIIREPIKPEEPDNFIVETYDKGIVNLTWTHPWKTGGRIAYFLISADLISSRLRMQIQQSQRGMTYRLQVQQYQSQYTKQVHLLSASTYKISVRAVTNMEIYGEAKVVQIQTPLAISFEKELSTEVCDSDSTISLHIPSVLNDTKDSQTYVIVKGPDRCKNYTTLIPYLRKSAGIKDYEITWCAATFPTDKFAGKTITIGDNKHYDRAKNCPLKPTKSYVIMVIVRIKVESMDDQLLIANTTSIRIGELHNEAWLNPISSILLYSFFVAISLGVGAAALYSYRRRRMESIRKLSLQDEIASSVGNLEVKSIASSSKHALTTTPTPSDKEFLSRASTPFDDGAIYLDNINQRVERMSLVKVKDFEDYVKQAVDSGLLYAQYNTLPRGQTKPWDYGKLPQNKPKNRYGNLIAYDENRVVLNKLPDDPYSDYINANYIKGYKKEKCYIATQGPKANTVVDFWRMIWQEESYVICMVANLVEGGKTKCEQYWPDIGKKKKYGDIIVFNAKHTVFADFTYRTLHATYGDEARKIEQLHYTAWPDHGVPLSTHSVATYLKKLLATPPGNGPVVVHCSAGVGRTGTIILCDMCLQRAAAEGVIDVLSETEAIRSQRANAIDNSQQYLLAHFTIVECLLSFPTSLPCDESLASRIKESKRQLQIQRDSLEKMTWQDKVLRPLSNQASLSERSIAKNRFPELASGNISRVYLRRYPPSDEDSCYISAVYVDGVRLQNQYLATQLPLPGTFSDFWRMVAEYKVELIVMLQPPDSKDTTCCPIVPSGEFKPVPYINIRTKDFAELEYYTSQKLILVDNLEKPAVEQQITILCSTEWKAGRNEDPPATMSLVTLWQTAERISRGDGPMVVLCHDGVTGCGLYLALSFLLERMSVERECDVCLAIRAIRRSRPDFGRSVEQMEYLYDAAITYLKYVETYANFTRSSAFEHR